MMETPFIPYNYNPQEINNFYNRHPVIVWERLVEIGSPILGWWILKKFDSFMAPYRTAEENNSIELERAADLKDAIVQGESVTFIKSGQALALRPDLIKSDKYIKELQKLQDEVGTFDNKVALRIIEEELGARPHDLFEFDPPQPIASASIGQVYKAKLKIITSKIGVNNRIGSSEVDNKTSGRDNSNNTSFEDPHGTTNNGQSQRDNIKYKTVAVKVQRPDALASAALDMFILRKLAAFVKFYKKYRSDLVGIADQFGSQLFSELNYVQEAQNCNRFRDLYGHITDIYIPSAYLELTTRRVLVMEFVEGVKGPWAVGGEKMLTVGLQCSVNQLLDSGYFHSDPHRGNLLQTPDGKLAYLDFGMMAEVPAKQRFGLIGTVIGLVNKDIPLVINNLQDLNFLPAGTDTQKIIRLLEQAIKNSTDSGEGSTLSFTKLNQNLNAISSELPFRLPPFYSLIIRTLTILEGLALSVDKDFRLIRGAYPFIAKQLLSSNSKELEALLKSILLTPTGKIRWEKLEQFISIASNADKATQGDFEALKRAQDRSDLIKTYAGTQDPSNFTADATIQIVDFLASNKGRFLREPLVTEVVDSIDNLGLTATTIASLATNNLIPAPLDKPNRRKVEDFVRVVQLFAEIMRSSLATPMARSENIIINELTLLPGFRLFINVIQQVAVIAASMNDPDNQTGELSKIEVLLQKSAALILQVVSQLMERNAKRVVKSVVNPDNIKELLPIFARLFDFQFPL